MSGLAEFLRAVASLMWPLLTASVLFFYREEVRAVLKRISHFKKGKFFGQEIELTEELDRLQQSVVEATAEVIAAPPSLLPGPAAVGNEDDFEEKLLTNPAQSPKIALMLLGSRIESRLNLLSASTGWPLRANELSGTALKPSSVKAAYRCIQLVLSNFSLRLGRSSFMG